MMINKEKVMTTNKNNKIYQVNISGQVDQLTIGSGNDVCNNKEVMLHEQNMRNNNSSHLEVSNNEQNDEKKSKEQDTHKQQSMKKGPSKWAKLLIPIIVPIIGAIISPIVISMAEFYLQRFFDKSVSEDNRIEQSSPIPSEPPFSIDEQSVEGSPFKYIECTLTSNFAVPGYQVKPYPYIAVLGSKGWTYLPIRGLYTQEQYSADYNGICKLKREDILTQLQDISTEVRKEIGTEYKIGCLLLIEYVANNSSKETEIYELGLGHLAPPENEAESIKILAAYQSDTPIKIDVTTWPSNREQIVKIINTL